MAGVARSRMSPVGRFEDRLARRGGLGPPAVTVLALLFYVLPVVMIIYGAFRTSAPGLPGSWSLSGVQEGFSSSRTWSTFGHSALVALVAGVPGTMLAVVFAAIAARTTVIFRRIITPMMMLVLAIPGLFFGLSWALLGAPRVGLINQILGQIGLPTDLVNVQGLWGIALVLGIKISPLAYLMIIGPFLAMDRRLEEASQISGAGRLKTFFRIDLPLTAPAIAGALIISLVIGLIAFEIPLLIGVPGGYRVFSTQIYAFINNSTPPNYASASSLAILLIATVLILVVVKWRLLDRRSFITTSGKGADRARWDLGAWGWLCNAVIALFALIAVVLPTIQLVIGSLEPAFGVTSYLSMDNYTAVLNDPQLRRALVDTLILAIAGGIIATFVSVAFAVVGRHGGRVSRRLLELTTWLPWATYGILLGLGLSWAFLTVPFLHGLFGTVWILLIALVVAITPLTSRTVEAALTQVGPELEEAARISGASSIRTTLGIVLRLMLPSLGASWFIGAIHIVGNLEVPILLSTPSNPTVAVEIFSLYQNGDTSSAAAFFCLILVLVGGAGAVLWAAFTGYRVWRGRHTTATPSGTAKAPNSTVSEVANATPATTTLTKTEQLVPESHG